MAISLLDPLVTKQGGNIKSGSQYRKACTINRKYNLRLRLNEKWKTE